MNDSKNVEADLTDLKQAIEAECAKLGITPKQYLEYIGQLREEKGS